MSARRGAGRGLRAEDLHKAFGSHEVLDGVDLDVPAGSTLAILGPSGSGKTTLLRVLAGFERPERGVVVLGDEVVEGEGRHVPAERRGIGYVPQEGSLFPHLSVEGNVGFGLARTERRRRVPELLEMVGLSEVAGRYPHQLSGGQQQRVAVARALAVTPCVVLLDEPFASLDAHLRASVRSDVHRVLEEAGTTTVLVTHDQDEALSTADVVAVLRGGRVAQVASPLELYRWPEDPEVARFVGEANLLAGQARGDVVETALGVLALERRPGEAPIHGEAAVLVRPEQVELDGPGSPGPRGRVRATGYYGHDAVVYVAAEGLASELVVRTLGDRRLEAGEEVGVSVRGAVRAWPAAHDAGVAASAKA